MSPAADPANYPAEITFSNAKDPSEVFRFCGVLAQATGTFIGIYESRTRPEVMQALKLDENGQPNHYNVAANICELAESRLDEAVDQAA